MKEELLSFQLLMQDNLRTVKKNTGPAKPDRLWGKSTIRSIARTKRRTGGVMQQSTGFQSTQRQAGGTRGVREPSRAAVLKVRTDTVAAGCGWWTCERDKHTRRRRATCYHNLKLK